MTHTPVPSTTASASYLWAPIARTLVDSQGIPRVRPYIEWDTPVGYAHASQVASA